MATRISKKMNAFMIILSLLFLSPNVKIGPNTVVATYRNAVIKKTSLLRTNFIIMELILLFYHPFRRTLIDSIIFTPLEE